MRRVYWILAAVLVLSLLTATAYLTYQKLRSNRTVRTAFRMVTTRSMDMSDAEAIAAEKKLASDPDDVATREDLISYYFDKSVQEREFVVLQEKRAQHVLWLIVHHPEDDFLAGPFAAILPDEPHFQEARASWLKAAQGNDVVVLRNAAAALFAEPETSRDLANRGLLRDPNDPKLRKLLAASFTRELRRSTSDAARAALASQGYHAWKAYLAVEKDEDEKFRNYRDIATVALEANDLAEAKQYATDLLAHAESAAKEASESGNIIRSQPDADDVHIANTVLGRVALRQGDLDEAKRRLLASANQQGSPVLGSFGPNMILASELLDRGQKDVVLQYLRNCSKFWSYGKDDLTKWESDIEKGKKPDFGSNLRY